MFSQKVMLYRKDRLFLKNFFHLPWIMVLQAKTTGNERNIFQKKIQFWSTWTTKVNFARKPIFLTEFVDVWKFPGKISLSPEAIENQ